MIRYARLWRNRLQVLGEASKKGEMEKMKREQKECQKSIRNKKNSRKFFLPPIKIMAFIFKNLMSVKKYTIVEYEITTLH